MFGRKLDDSLFHGLNPLHSSRSTPFALGALSLIVLFSSFLFAQSTPAPDYLAQIGTPDFTTASPVELGFINLANGNLHLEIPLGDSFPQRGGRAVQLKFRYDSRIWTTLDGQFYGNGNWSLPQNGGQGGWRSFTGIGGFVNYQSFDSTNPAGCALTTYTNFVFTDSEGNDHSFGDTQTQIGGPPCNYNSSSATGSSWDNSGYSISITNDTSAVVTARDGSSVYPLIDLNGNAFPNAIGQFPFSTTTNCGGVSGRTCYDILNSQGTTSRYTVTTTQIPVHTAFGQPGYQEYSGNIPVITSIQLPDGTSYQFTYDSGTASGHYGDMLSMKLPTGATVNYGYTIFNDSIKTRNRWITSRSNSSGTWSYTPTVVRQCTFSGLNGPNPTLSGAPCQQQVSVSKPAGGTAAYLFTMNGNMGTFAGQVQYFDTDGSILETDTTQYDTSGSCNWCSPGAVPYTKPKQETVTFPMPGGGSIARTKQYQYLIHVFPTQVSEWNYYAGALPSSPARITNITYSALYKPNSITATDGAGNSFSQTNLIYDAAPLVSVTGAYVHDDTNFGTSKTARGNVTEIQLCTVFGASCTASNSLTTDMTYDTTGQLRSVKDANGNTTTLSYTDNFYQDSSSIQNPPATFSAPVSTNAYLTSVTSPLVGTSTFGYYYHSGKRAISTDANGASNIAHFIDSLDRLTHAFGPLVVVPGTSNTARPWSLTTYAANETQVDSYASILDTVASTSCSSCVHSQGLTDSLGRPTTQVLVSDPDGATTVATSYDANGRPASTTNPYRTTSDPTYGSDTQTYDGIGRVISISHSGGGVSRTYFGAKVTPGGGLSAQQCPASVCGIGYPVLTVDETGKPRQSWTDAFGRTIEVDEPNANGTFGTAGFSISGSEQTETICPGGHCVSFPDSGSVTVNGVSTSYGPGSSPSSIAAALASQFGVPANGSSFALTASTPGPTGQTYTASVTSGAVSTNPPPAGSLSVPSFNINGAACNTSGGSGDGTCSTSGVYTGGTGGLGTPSATVYLYDLRNNLTCTAQPGASAASFTSCAAASASWRPRTYIYDVFSRVTSVTLPETGTGSGSHTTSLTYSMPGALCSGSISDVCSKTDPRALTSTYTYDARNRPTKITYSDGTSTVQYGYDGTTLSSCGTGPPAISGATNLKGRRSSMCNGASGVSWSYDASGQLLVENRKMSGGITKATSYTYNLDGSVASIVYPTGRVVGYTYSNAQRPTSAMDADGTAYVFSASYAPTGAASSIVYGKSGTFSGITETANYNSLLEYTGTKATSSAGTALDFSYNYSLPSGNNGLIAGVTDNLVPGRSQNYAYDLLNRVTSASTQANTGTDCWGQTFGIDAVANLTSVAVSQCTATPLSVTANNNNQLSGLTFDLAGNTLTDGNNTYTYDAENRVKAAAGVTYGYDGDGIRVKKSNGTLYWPLSETNLTGTIINEYIFFGGEMVARRDGSANVFYVYADQLGSTRKITNAQGVVCYDADFTPYGQELVKTGGCPINYKYAGYERDAETGNDYASARYYNPRLGRFLQPDSFSGSVGNPQSENLYAYVNNNPLNFVDPTGHGCEDDGERDSQYCDSGDDNGGSVDGAGSSAVFATGGAAPAVHCGVLLCLWGAISGWLHSPGLDLQPPQFALEGLLADAHKFGRQADGSYKADLTSPDIARRLRAGFIATNSDWVGESHQCVAACKRFSQMESNVTSRQWVRGLPVVGNNIPPGTAIASGWNSKKRYPQSEDPHKNSGILLGPAVLGPPGSIRILDQFPSPPNPAQPRDVRYYADPKYDVSNNANAYYVILVPRH